MKRLSWPHEVVSLARRMSEAPTAGAARVGATLAIAYAILDLADAVRDHADTQRKDRP